MVEAGGVTTVMTLAAPAAAAQATCLGTTIDPAAHEAASDGAWPGIFNLAAPGWHGLAWRCHFRAGHLHQIVIDLKPGSRSRFRLELHGAMSRYQRCFCEVDALTGATAGGEEMLAASAEVGGNGECRIRCSFVPQLSSQHWFYLLALDEAAATDADDTAAAFRIGGFEMTAAANPTAGFRAMQHHPAIDIADGVIFALQSSMFIRNYFHLEFELALDERRAVAIDLTTRHAVAHAVWMSPDPPPADPVPAPVAPATPNTIRLAPVAGGATLPSPGLCDRLGPEFAWSGHAIWGIFAGWTDIQSDPPDVSGRHPEWSMAITCDDGALIEICLDDAMLRRLAAQARPTVDQVFWQIVGAMPGGRFLEVGGRGPRAVRVRQRLGRAWHYTGFDVLPGENVDVVGDAHLLSHHVDRSSIDVLYADQVMEHLLAPWKFIIEANRVLRTGGLLCLMTPSTCPLHAEPWDFYRFSDHSWLGMLNRETGFEIIDRSLTTPMVVSPRIVLPGAERMQYGAAYMITSVLARKIGDTTADWSAYQPGLAFGLYPNER
jgi:SAM-dependent methyltransferase